MSYVTNVLISCSILEEEMSEPERLGGYSNIIEINRWLEESGHGEFRYLSRHAGGKKVMEAEVWGAAFNYIRLEELIDFIRSLNWLHPRQVQLFIQDEDEDIFTERYQE